MTQTCKEKVMPAYRYRIGEIKQAWKAQDSTQKVKGFDERSFGEYGVSVEWIPVGTFTGQTQSYVRYLLSTGGPREEFRFYVDEDRTLSKIEFWYLDWAGGAKVSIREGGNYNFLKILYSEFRNVIPTKNDSMEY